LPVFPTLKVLLESNQSNHSSVYILIFSHKKFCFSILRGQVKQMEDQGMECVLFIDESSIHHKQGQFV
jgi:hypothetical protein